MSRPLLAEYVRAGWVLVPIPLGMKGPTHAGWNSLHKGVIDPEVAEYMDGNVGLAHAYSGTCCVDVDDLDTAAGWFSERGVDLSSLLQAPDAVMISSGRPNRAKLLYKQPTPLPSFKLPGFELRCATRNGKTVQDALPPSIHPDTQREYTWVYNDALLGSWNNLPPLPPALAELWLSYAKQYPVAAATTTQKPSTSRKALRELLGKHDPDAAYDKWLAVGMALHHEYGGAEDGLAAWDEWSRGGKKYKSRDDLATHWRSFRSDAANPLTLASLRVEEAAQADEFDDLSSAPVPAAPMPLAAEVAEVANKLARDKNGRALAVLPNILPVLSASELCGQRLAHDSFRDEILLSPHGTGDWRPFRDTDYTAMRVWFENALQFYPVSRDLVRDAVHFLAEANQMDSAQMWLSSLQWDGTPRVDTFFPRYMGTIDAGYERAVGRYLWSAFAGRVMAPGCQVDMVPIIVGAQGVGKSQGVRALAPAPEHFVEIRLDESDDVVARKIRGVLVGEIAELRGLSGPRPVEMDRIKAFITRTHEKWTPKYQEFATTFARRIVMIGTTNDDEFLVEDENRRWLPVRTAGVDVEAITRDRDQLWAEGLQIWLTEGVSWAGAQRLAVAQHKEYIADDQWLPIVQQWLADNPAPYVRLHDLLVSAVGLDVRSVTRAHELRGGRVLRSLGYERSAIRGEKGGLVKVWVPKGSKKHLTADNATATVDPGP